MRKRLFLVLSVLLLALSTGCQRIQLYEAEAGVYLRVTVDTSLDPAVETLLDFDARPELLDKVAGKTPELVRACFYDVVSHELVKEDFLPLQGGFVDVPAGAYDVVVYSLGTEATQVAGTETRAGAYAFTSPTGSRVKMQGASGKADEDEADEQPVVFEPDHLFVGRIAGALVPVRPTDAETTVLSAELSRLTDSWILEVIEVVGAERIRKAEVYLTGQTADRYLWDGRTSNRTCAIGFETEIDVTEGRLFAVFNSFGRSLQTETDVIVNVLVTTENGSRCRYVYDVTDQWLNPDNAAHRIVVEEPVEIPGDDYQGGGFDPIVNDWDGEAIPIIIE